MDFFSVSIPKCSHSYFNKGVSGFEVNEKLVELTLEYYKLSPSYNPLTFPCNFKTFPEHSINPKVSMMVNFYQPRESNPGAWLL